MTSWVSYCKETHQRVQLIGRLTKSFGKCLQPFFKVKYSMQSLGNHHFLFICFFLHRWIDHKSSASFCFTRKCFHGDYSNKRCCCECYTAKRGFTSTLNYNSSLLLCYQSCCSEKYVLGLNCVIIFVDMNVPRLSFFTKYKWEAASASCCIFHSFPNLPEDWLELHLFSAAQSCCSRGLTLTDINHTRLVSLIVSWGIYHLTNIRIL